MWEQFAKRGVTRKVCLRATPPDKLVPWLALPAWLKAVHEVEEVPGELLRRFVATQTTSLLELIVPED